MSENNSKENIISKIETEIAKISSNSANIYFFVMDTKSYPNSQLKYEYTLAKILHDNGYKVTMMYQERPVDKKDEAGQIVLGEDGKPEKVDPFVGVESWLGSEYSELPHVNSFTNSIKLSPADILFIPEIYASVMQQSKNFPCKRVGIVTNYTQLVEALPVPEHWGDYGVVDAIVPTETLAKQMKDIFPYLDVKVVNPYVDESFTEDKSQIKDMLISVLCKDKSKFVKILSPFYWKFPMYRWCVFSEVKGMDSETFAKALKNSAFTVFVDDDSTFAISALEAMKAGSIVIGKIPDVIPDWMIDESGEKLRDCGFWTDNILNLPNIIANAVRMYTTDTLPDELLDEERKTADKFTKENTENQIKEYVSSILNSRLEQLNKSLDKIKNS